MRMIVVFQKNLALRHIGHLDLMRAMQRALRRSNLPIRYSNGFNPHIQLSFASPLSVGVVGIREIMDVPVEGEYDPDQFAATLQKALPAALQIMQVRAVADDYPTLMALVSGSRLRIQLDAGPDADAIADAFHRFMALKEVQTMRKTKSGEKMTDIRPFVMQADIHQTDDGYQIRCEIANRADGSLKPSVLMRALCEMAKLESVPYIAYRDTILAKRKDGTAIPLEAYEDG